MAIEQLTIDGVQYVVAELPQGLQDAVKKYEEWRDRLNIAQDEVTLVNAALQQLGGAIVNSVREFNAAKASVEAAKPDETVEAAAEAPVSE